LARPAHDDSHVATSWARPKFSPPRSIGGHAPSRSDIRGCSLAAGPRAHHNERRPSMPSIARRHGDPGGMATQTTKAKRIDALPKKPTVARAEIVDKATRVRFETELDAALKRKPTSEVKLAGALRAVGRLSPALRATLVEVAQVMVRRG